MDRWWDEPDASGNLALVDGSDPQMGVSVAILGFHALAKRELDRLSTTTLMDARRVEEAYDRVDLGPVRKAVEAATADVLGAVPAAKYADLVVEDWRSRARAASGRLSRTLVAKGLSWPRAVSRTASVAGVPIERLSRYATVVSSPGLDPLSVADAADRVLMEYAAHRGGMEMPASVVVSKERQRIRHREREEVSNPEFERQVKRDELGQFAAQNTNAEQKQREDRRKKRMERRARREKREAREAEESKETTQTEASGTEREPQEGGVQREVAREGQVDRETLREADGGDMLVLGANQVPEVGGLANPVLVDDPLYLVVTRRQTHLGTQVELVSDMAFTRRDARLLAGHVSRNDPSRPGMNLLRFGAEGVPVMGTQMYTRSVADNPFKAKGFKLAFEGNIRDHFDIGNVEVEKPLSLMGPATHAGMNAPIYEAILKADEGGRQRTRRRQQVKNPEFEREVKRDRLGQFTAQGEEGEEAQRLRAERRTKRMERRARREKREEAERQEATQTESQAQREVPREERVEREVPREAKVTREVTRESVTPSNGAWEDFVDAGMQDKVTKVRILGGGTLASAGFGLQNNQETILYGGRPTFFEMLDNGWSVGLVDVLKERAERGVSGTEFDQIENRYKWVGRYEGASPVSHLYEHPNDEDLLFISAAHDLATELSGETPRGYSAYTSIHGSTKDAATSVFGHAMEAMASSHQRLLREPEAKSAKGAFGTWESQDVEDGYAIDIPGPDRQVVMRDPSHSPGPGNQLLVSSSTKAQGGLATDHSYVSIVHPETVRLMELIADVTRPGNTEVDRTERRMAGEKLIARYDRDGKQLTLAQLVQAALIESDVRAVQLDQETKYDLASQQLQRRNYPAVRLDNVDVLRIY